MLPLVPNDTLGDKGLMLSAFFWGYAVGQLPSSYLASVLGATVFCRFSYHIYLTFVCIRCL